jgi:hypothetical protein
MCIWLDRRQHNGGPAPFLRRRRRSFALTQALTVRSKQKALEMPVNKRLCTSTDVRKLVIPAKAGIQFAVSQRNDGLDSGLRRNDGGYAAFPSENSRKISMLYLGNRHEKL